MARPKISLPEPNLIDRAVNFIAPVWGLQRLQARAKQAVIRGYGQSFAATKDGKGKKDRISAGGEEDLHLDQKTLWELREIGYELDRNNGLSCSVIDQATVNAIGPWGFAHYARTSSPELNKRIERGFGKWLAEECDPAGEDHGWERLKRSYRQTKIAGDEFWQVDDYDRLSPPVWRTIEAPRVLTPYERNTSASSRLQKVDGREMIHGITKDSNGRIQNIFVADRIPLIDVVSFNDGTLLRGDRIISLIRHRRESGTRCPPIMSPVVRELDDLQDLMTSERLALRLAAAMGIFIETDDDPTALANHMADLYGETDDNGDRIETWDPASVNYMKRGQKASLLQAQRPATEVQAFMRMIMRYVGLPLGLPYELFFLDFSQSTLGTLRVALNTAQRRFRDEQFWYSTKLDRLYNWWMSVMVSRGRYPRRDDIYDHEWGLPGWPSPQPLQDANAAKVGIENRFSSRTIASRNLGEDWETVRQDLEREDAAILAHAAANGYNVATDTGKQLPPADQQKGAKPNAA